MMKKVYIIILNYNGWKDTIECLESVLKTDYLNYQIVVVDNNSLDNSMEYLIKWIKGDLCLYIPNNNPLKNLSFPIENKPLNYILYTQEEALSASPIKETDYNNPIIFIQAEQNRGFAAGNNIGIKYAFAKNDFEYIYLLNNDAVIQTDTISKFVNYINNKTLHLLGSIQYSYYNPKSIQAIGGGFSKLQANFWNYQTIKDIKKIDYIYGASMFFKKETLQKVGLLNEEYFLYYEEIDYAERLKKIKLKQEVVKFIGIYHKHSQTISKEDNDFREYFLEKNKIIFYKNYYKYLLFIPVLKSLKKYLFTFKKIYLQSIKDGLK